MSFNIINEKLEHFLKDKTFLEATEIDELNEKINEIANKSTDNLSEDLSKLKTVLNELKQSPPSIVKKKEEIHHLISEISNKELSLLPTIESLKKSAETDPDFPSKLSRLGIKDIGLRHELAQLCASHFPKEMARFVIDFHLDDAQFIQIIRLLLNNVHLSDISQISEIKDPDTRFEIALSLASQEYTKVAKNIDLFQIKDQGRLLQLASVLAEKKIGD